MRTTDGMSAPGYADLIRRIVAWIEKRETYATYHEISRRYRLTLDEVEDVVGDSEVYGPKIMPHANQTSIRGNTTVELMS